jgi:hypothetical protein
VANIFDLSTLGVESAQTNTNFSFTMSDWNSIAKFVESLQFPTLSTRDLTRYRKTYSSQRFNPQRLRAVKIR